MKILLFVLTLLAAGVALTLSLPEFKVDSASKDTVPSYSVDQNSLIFPYKMQDLLLITPAPQEAKYGLRLGLYSKLQQATKAAQSLPLPTATTLIKAEDKTREWYLVTLGPFASSLQAEQQKQWLQNNQISATLILWPNSEPKSK